MTYFPLRFILPAIALITFFSFGPSVSAVDCPSVSLKNFQGSFVGMHVTSNTAPLQNGVRLMWKDPNIPKPTTVAIFRKKAGQPFQQIGSVAGGIETYLDTKIEAKTASYFYALKNTYLCGSTNSSRYIEVPLMLQRDNSEPRLTFLGNMKNGVYMQGKEDPLMFVARDSESGVNPTTIQIKHDNKTVTGGKTLGNMQSLIWYFYPSKNEFTQTSTGSTLALDAKNGLSVSLPSQDRELPLELYNNTNTVRFSSPALNALVDTTKPLVLNWKPRSTTPGSFVLSVSSDLGKNWKTLQSDNSMTFTINSLATLLPELLEKRKEALLLFKVILIEEDQHKAYDILPLTVGNINFKINTYTQTLYTPEGGYKIFDAYTGKAVYYTPANNTLTEIQKSWKFVQGIKESGTILPPGYYYIKTAFSSFHSPVYLPEDHEGIFYFPGGNLDIALSADPMTVYAEQREELDNNTIEIISSLLEPDSKYPYTFPESQTPSSNSNTNTATPVDPSDSTVPLKVTVSYCINDTFICRNDAFTALNKHSVTLNFDPLKRAFFSSNASITSEEKSLIGIPTAPRNYFFSVDEKYYIQFPASLVARLSEESQSTPLITIEKKTTDGPYVFTPSKQLELLAAATSDYVFIREQGNCKGQFTSMNDITGKETSYFALCLSGIDLVSILPFGMNTILKMSPKLPTTASTEWYAPYMNILSSYNIFLQPSAGDIPHENITRGELADLIVKSYHIPSASYTEIFTDLPRDHQYAPSILALEKALVVKGELSSSGSRIVRPDSPVLRAEALKMIMAASRVKKPVQKVLVPVVPFKDVLLHHWFYPYVDTAYQLQIVEGYKNADGSRELRPGSFVTRAEAAKIIITSLQKKFEE